VVLADYDRVENPDDTPKVVKLIAAQSSLALKHKRPLPRSVGNAGLNRRPRRLVHERKHLDPGRLTCAGHLLFAQLRRTGPPECP